MRHLLRVFRCLIEDGLAFDLEALARDFLDVLVLLDQVAELNNFAFNRVRAVL